MQKTRPVGLGVQGQAHLEALQDILNFQEIAVVDTADVSDKCKDLAKQHGIFIHPSTPSEAVTGVDLVVTITRSKQPVFDGIWLKPGTSVCTVGTSIPSGSSLNGNRKALSRQARS